MNKESMSFMFWSKRAFCPFKTIRKALIYFSDLRAATISAMCFVSLPSESANPGVSMRMTSLSEHLHVSCFLLVYDVSDY